MEKCARVLTRTDDQEVPIGMGNDKDDVSQQ